ncbi:MAG TPA: SPOR domain-containing protein [Polyangia bacterium]|nr:SPOR domain-containing protein [Polyangia bacterium]
MSLRYTAVTSMDGPALEESDRNVERWREKIEVKLDNRQVFFLFFGSAVVACMLFVLGVMVGKRIESRGQADAPVLQDPLAALDRAHQPPVGVAAPVPQLTFPSTLGGSASRGKGSVHAALAAPPKIAPPKAPAAPKPVALAKPAAAAKPVAAAALDPAKVKGKYTLQISSFATSAEAQAFVQKLPGAFVIAGDVPGKGTLYRVRFGNYASYKDAAAAKEGFEKQHNMIALVAAR